MTIMERVATALEIKKIGRKNLTVSFLGEGAWHEAYLFSTNELESTVIRFRSHFLMGSLLPIMNQSYLQNMMAAATTINKQIK